MAFKGWAVALNGVLLSGGGCGDGQQEWDESACGESLPMVVLDRLTAPPEGLDLPGLRTEDVTFPQRDGVKHYSDWYEPRFITLQGTLGPNECDVCTDVREQRAALLQAWKKSCCDVELVIYPPCFDEVYDEFPTPQLLTDRINYVTHNSRGQAYTSQCGTFEFTTLRGFGDGTGDYSTFEESSDLPAELVAPQDVARKTWTTGMETQVACYPDCYHQDNLGCYDQTIAGSNDAAGFLMGCTGRSAFPVTEGDPWTLSGYMRASVSGWNLLVRVMFYDGSGSLVSGDEGDVVVSVADTWQRISATITVPVGAVTMQWVLDTGDGGTLIQPGDTLDATAALAENAASLGAYFDGDFTDTDDPVLGGQKVDYTWDGDDFASLSHELSYEYVPGPNRELNGPFSVVGRPRAALAPWRRSKKGIADFVLRFDAADHRMFILDACGTPGTQDCVTMEPGSSKLASCYPSCYPECYDQPVAGSKSVPPTSISVIGTETVYPVITLNGSLLNPRVENVSTGQSITFQGFIAESDPPVIINTEDGTAFQGENSVTHLIGGTLDFGFDPGMQDLRLLSQSLDDDGTAEVCFRPVVIAA